VAVVALQQVVGEVVAAVAVLYQIELFLCQLEHHME
jgi:hypothetical protein